MGYYCQCGYDTEGTESCKQTDCIRFKAVEMQKAKQEIEKSILTATEKYTRRISCLFKTE